MDENTKNLIFGLTAVLVIWLCLLTAIVLVICVAVDCDHRAKRSEHAKIIVIDDKPFLLYLDEDVEAEPIEAEPIEVEP